MFLIDQADVLNPADSLHWTLVAWERINDWSQECCATLSDTSFLTLIIYLEDGAICWNPNYLWNCKITSFLTLIIYLEDVAICWNPNGGFRKVQTNLHCTVTPHQRAKQKPGFSRIVACPNSFDFTIKKKSLEMAKSLQYAFKLLNTVINHWYVV